jgi:hypothetical protein
MVKKSKQILREALELHPVERAELVEKLLSSFILSPDHSIDILWEKEVEERIDANENQQIKSIPAQMVFDKIGDKEKKQRE